MNIIQVTLSDDGKEWRVICNDCEDASFPCGFVAANFDAGLARAKAFAFDLYLQYAEYGLDVKIIS